MSGAFNVWWLFLIIAAIVMVGGTVVLGIIFCRGRGNTNDQAQNQNLLIENAEEVNIHNQNQILLIRNVDENQKDLIVEDGLTDQDNLNLNEGSSNKEVNECVTVIFDQIIQDWQNIAQVIENLYDIKNADNAFDEGSAKLKEIIKYLMDIDKQLEKLSVFIPKIENFEPIKVFLDCLSQVYKNKNWLDQLDDIKKNYYEYVRECFVMGNDNNPKMRRNDIVPEINRAFGEFARNWQGNRNNNRGPINIFEFISTNRQRNENMERGMNDQTNNLNNQINVIRQENNRENQRAMEDVNKKIIDATERVFAEWDKRQKERDKELEKIRKQNDKELEEIKRKTAQIQKETEQIKKENKERSEKADRELEEMKRKTKEMDQKLEETKKQNKIEIEAMKKENAKEIEQMRKETEKMKNENTKLYAQLFGNLLKRAEIGEKRAEDGEKSMRQLKEEICNLSDKVSSISSRNSLQNNSFKIFGDDQETPGNEQNLNSSFANANANINLNINQKENEKSDGKKSLLDKIEDAKNQVEYKKEDVPKIDKGKDLNEDKKEEDKK